jgi:PAS domain S-box-containing protein
MKHQQPTRCNAYVCAVLVTIAALVIYAAIDRHPGTPVMVALELPVIIAAYLGGVGPGLVATLVAAFGADYLFIDAGSVSLIADVQSLRWDSFVVIGVVVSALNQALHASTTRADASRLSAEQALVERNRTEAALRASEERIREITDTISEVFWLSNPEKSHLEYVSRAYETIWGRTRERIYESPLDWVEAVHPDDRGRVVDAAMSKQLDGSYDEEYRIVRPDGTIRWIRDRAFPVRDAEGAVIRIAGIAEDITDRRQLEAQLTQAQKMESIGQLAGGVAHDFNNFLTVIIGSAQLLEASVAADPGAMQLVEEIQAAGVRATSLTRQLLAFSRKDLAEPRVLEFNGVIADTQKMLRRLLGEDVLLTSTLDPKTGCARIDPGQWVQVLMNLAVNARDAMPAGGRLTIETRAVDLRDPAPGGLQAGRYAELTVTDTGTGIAPSVKAHVFEPFFTTKKANRGTGLGLAVVYGIVKQSGGHIQVESEARQGTTFRIWLPVVESQPLSMPHRVHAHVGGTETILVVEDDPTVRRLAVRGLSGCGYHVIEAADGLQATQLLQNNTAVDLMVTDVVMPGISGRELADAVRELRPDLKVLYTSGYTADDVVRRGVETAHVAFLAKPYEPQSLAAKVRGVLDQRAA